MEPVKREPPHGVPKGASFYYSSIKSCFFLLEAEDNCRENKEPSLGWFPLICGVHIHPGFYTVSLHDKLLFRCPRTRGPS